MNINFFQSVAVENGASRNEDERRHRRLLLRSGHVTCATSAAGQTEVATTSLSYHANRMGKDGMRNENEAAKE